ncbi:hypothetical protein LTR53_001331 [Teratosphaeriaceae sp. CCFEE 6253]|nr:hypothetical protein LTR53_001331 [Teratosphaeriaceae sp. CCFEE 6253]
MWKAFSGRSESGSISGLRRKKSSSGRAGASDAGASSTARRDDESKRGHRSSRSAYGDDDTKSSTSTYATAPSSRVGSGGGRALTESAVRGLGGGHDDWEDDDRAKSEKRSRHGEGSEGRHTHSRSEKERSESRERKERRRESASHTGGGRSERSHGKRRMDDSLDATSGARAMPAMGSFEQFPDQYSAALVGPVQPHGPTMSGALPTSDPMHQFPSQIPRTFDRPQMGPTRADSFGAAADYYMDEGQSIHTQPGHRASTPNMLVNPDLHLHAASATPNPAADTGHGSAADFYGHTASASQAPVPAKPPPSTQRPASGRQPSGSSNRPLNVGAVASTAAAIAATAGVVGASSGSYHENEQRTSSYQQSSSSRPQAQSRQRSPRPSADTNGAAGSYYAPAPQQFPLSQSNSAGAAAAEAAAYGSSSHMYSTSYGGGGGGGQGPSRPQFAPGEGSYGNGVKGMHYHEHRGPITRLKDGFLNILSSPEDVRRMEEYTEYIGVCKYCFDPRSTPNDGPRQHHFHRRPSEDSFEELRRRKSYERMQRKGSNETLRRRVDKEGRYYSSDRDKRGHVNKSGVVAAGLAAAGVAAGANALFNDRKDFDDTYSVKSGHRAGSAARRRSRSSSHERRRRSEHGVIRADHRDEYVTVRTSDGRVERRRVQHSEASQSHEHHNGLAGAAAGAAIGAAAASFVARDSRNPQGAHTEGAFVRHHSRSRSRSHSPGLGEIFGFSGGKASNSTRRPTNGASHGAPRHERRSSREESSMLGSFFSPSQNERRPRRNSREHRKKQRGFFGLGSGSASSSDDGMAFGEGFASKTNLPLRRKSSSRVVRKRSDDHFAATVAGIGVTAAALAAAQKGHRIGKRTSRPELGAHRDVRIQHDDNRVHDQVDEDGWEDELPSDADDASSTHSDLAFGEGSRLSHRQSMESVSSGDGLSAWGWRWGGKDRKKRRRPSSPSPPHPPGYRASGIGPVSAVSAANDSSHDFPTRSDEPKGVFTSSTGVSQQPMQYIDPRPMSDAGSRHGSMPGTFEPSMARPGPAPLQQPQPIAPISPAFVQDAFLDDRPKPKRTASSPTRSSFGLQDAALIGVGALAAGSIIAGQGRKSKDAPNVRFGLTDEQQQREDRQRRREREGIEEERRRADRTRALKEEAERHAKEEDAHKREEAVRRKREEENRLAAEAVLAKQRAAQQEAEQQAGLDRERDERRLREQQEAEEQRQVRLAEETRRADQDRRQREAAAAAEATREKQARQQRETQIQAEIEAKQRELDEQARQRRRAEEAHVERVRRAEEEALERRRAEDADRERARQEDERSRESSAPWGSVAAGAVATATAGAVLAGSEHGRYREKDQEKVREHDSYPEQQALHHPILDEKPVSYAAKQITPDGQASGSPIMDDDLFNKDFFSSQRGQSEYARRAVLARKAADKIVAEREAYYQEPAQSQADFFAPRDILSQPHAGKTRVADPYDDNDVDVYRATDDTPVMHIGPSNDGSRHAPYGVPSLNVICATPPPSTPASAKSYDARPHSPLIQEVDEKPTAPQRPSKRDRGRSISWGQDKTHVYDPPTPESFQEHESYMHSRDVPTDAAAAAGAALDEIVVEAAEPGEGTRSTRYKTGRQPDTDTDSVDGPPCEAGAYRRPLYTSDSDLDGHFGADPPGMEEAPPVRGFVEGETDEPTPAGERAPHMPGAFEDDVETPRGDERYEVIEPSQPISSGQWSALDPAPPTESTESDWAPQLSKKDKKKREKAAKRGTGFDSEPSEPATPIPGGVSSTLRDVETPFEMPSETPFQTPFETSKQETVDYFPSKKDQKKRDKASKRAATFDDVPSEPVTPASDDVRLPAYGATDAVETIPEDQPAPVASKKDKKKREKASKRTDAYYEPSEPNTPLPAEEIPLPLDEPAEAAQEEPEEYFTGKKDKKKRDKAAKRAAAFENDFSEPSTPVSADTEVAQVRLADEPQQGLDDYPMSEKDKKRREKPLARDGLDEYSPVEPEAKRTGILDEAPSTEATASEPDARKLSKKEQKKRDKGAKSSDFDEAAATAVVAGGIAALPDTDAPAPETDWLPPSKKTKSGKKKAKQADFDATDAEPAQFSPAAETPTGMPGGWGAETPIELPDPFQYQVKDDEPTPSQEEDPFAEFSSGKSKKKKKKRESARFSEPVASSPLRSEWSHDDYIGSRPAPEDETRPRGEPAFIAEPSSYTNGDRGGYSGGTSQSGTHAATNVQVAEQASLDQAERGYGDGGDNHDSGNQDSYATLGSQALGPMAGSARVDRAENGPEYMNDAQRNRDNADGHLADSSRPRSANAESGFDQAQPVNELAEAADDFDARSVVASEPGSSHDGSRKSKHRSKREDADAASITSSRSRHEREKSPVAKKEKKSGLFGLFSRKSSESVPIRRQSTHSEDPQISRTSTRSGDNEEGEQEHRRRKHREGSTHDDDDTRSVTSEASRRHRRDHREDEADGEHQRHSSRHNGDDADSRSEGGHRRHHRDEYDDDDDTASRAGTQGGHRHHHRRRRTGEEADDLHDQSFLGDRVEELPPLPASPPESPASAPVTIEQDHGTPTLAEADARLGLRAPEDLLEIDSFTDSMQAGPKIKPEAVQAHMRDTTEASSLPLPVSTPGSPVVQDVHSNILQTDSGDGERDSRSAIDLRQLPSLPLSEPSSPAYEAQGQASSEVSTFQAREGGLSWEDEVQQLPALPASPPDSPLETPNRPPPPARPTSTTAIPLRFPFGHPRSPNKERSASFHSPLAASPASPSSAHKKPRPSSTEFRPLYLVERNRKPQDVEETLPSLPSSKPSSRGSSTHGSEDWHSAIEDPPSPGREKRLTIDVNDANAYRYDDEYLGSEQATPKASEFPATVLDRPAREAPQFYTWDDFEQDERLHGQPVDGTAQEEGSRSYPDDPELSPERSRTDLYDAERLPDLPKSRPGSPYERDVQLEPASDRFAKGFAAAALLGGAAVLGRKAVKSHEDTRRESDPRPSEDFRSDRTRGDSQTLPVPLMAGEAELVSSMESVEAQDRPMSRLRSGKEQTFHTTSGHHSSGRQALPSPEMAATSTSADLDPFLAADRRTKEDTTVSTEDATQSYHRDQPDHAILGDTPSDVKLVRQLDSRPASLEQIDVDGNQSVVATRDAESGAADDIRERSSRSMHDRRPSDEQPERDQSSSKLAVFADVPQPSLGSQGSDPTHGLVLGSAPSASSTEQAGSEQPIQPANISPILTRKQSKKGKKKQKDIKPWTVDEVPGDADYNKRQPLSSLSEERGPMRDEPADATPTTSRPLAEVPKLASRMTKVEDDLHDSSTAATATAEVESTAKSPFLEQSVDDASQPSSLTRQTDSPPDVLEARQGPLEQSLDNELSAGLHTDEAKSVPDSGLPTSDVADVGLDVPLNGAIVPAEQRYELQPDQSTRKSSDSMPEGGLDSKNAAAAREEEVEPVRSEPMHSAASAKKLKKDKKKNQWQQQDDSEVDNVTTSDSAIVPPLGHDVVDPSVPTTLQVDNDEATNSLPEHVVRMESVDEQRPPPGMLLPGSMGAAGVIMSNTPRSMGSEETVPDAELGASSRRSQTADAVAEQRSYLQPQETPVNEPVLGLAVEEDGLEPQQSSDVYWQPMPKKSKKGKKGKRGETVESEGLAPSESTDAYAKPRGLTSTPTESEQAADMVVDEPASEHARDTWTPPPSKKKGKKGRLEAFFSPTEEGQHPSEHDSTPPEPDQVVPPGLDQESLSNVEVAEAESETMWLPSSSKKGKKGNKAAQKVAQVLTGEDNKLSDPPRSRPDHEVQDSLTIEDAGNDGVLVQDPGASQVDNRADEEWAALPSKGRGKKGKKSAKAGTATPAPDTYRESEAVRQGLELDEEMPVVNGGIAKGDDVDLQVTNPAIDVTEADSYWTPLPTKKKGKKVKKAQFMSTFGEDADHPQTIDDTTVTTIPEEIREASEHGLQTELSTGDDQLPSDGYGDRRFVTDLSEPTHSQQSDEARSLDAIEVDRKGQSLKDEVVQYGPLSNEEVDRTALIAADLPLPESEPSTPLADVQEWDNGFVQRKNSKKGKRYEPDTELLATSESCGDEKPVNSNAAARPASAGHDADATWSGSTSSGKKKGKKAGKVQKREMLEKSATPKVVATDSFAGSPPSDSTFGPSQRALDPVAFEGLDADALEFAEMLAKPMHGPTSLPQTSIEHPVGAGALTSALHVDTSASGDLQEIPADVFTPEEQDTKNTSPSVDEDKADRIVTGAQKTPASDFASPDQTWRTPVDPLPDLAHHGSDEELPPLPESPTFSVPPEDLDHVPSRTPPVPALQDSRTDLAGSSVSDVAEMVFNTATSGPVTSEHRDSPAAEYERMGPDATGAGAQRGARGEAEHIDDQDLKVSKKGKKGKKSKKSPAVVTDERWADYPGQIQTDPAGLQNEFDHTGARDVQWAGSATASATAAVADQSQLYGRETRPAANEDEDSVFLNLPEASALAQVTTSEEPYSVDRFMPDLSEPEAPLGVYQAGTTQLQQLDQPTSHGEWPAESSTKRSKKDKRRVKEDAASSLLLGQGIVAAVALEHDPDHPVGDAPRNSDDGEMQAPLVINERTPEVLHPISTDGASPLQTDKSVAAVEEWPSFSTKRSKKDKKRAKKDYVDPPAFDAASATASDAPIETVRDEPIADVAKGAGFEARGVNESGSDGGARNSMLASKQHEADEPRKSEPRVRSESIGESPDIGQPAEPQTTAIRPVHEGESLPVAPSAEPRPLTRNGEASQATGSDEHRHSTAEHQIPAQDDHAATTQPIPDIDFAATLAAGLADSGFSPDLVVNDSTFHRRASPPGVLPEADPEEVSSSATMKRRKKDKKGRRLDVPAWTAESAPDQDENPEVEKSERFQADQPITGFDADIAGTLQQSGFGPDLLERAMSTQGTPAPGALEDDAALSFATARRKKKGKKGKAVADDAVSQSFTVPENEKPDFSARSPSSWQQQANVSVTDELEPHQAGDVGAFPTTSKTPPAQELMDSVPADTREFPGSYTIGSSGVAESATAVDPAHTFNVAGDRELDIEEMDRAYSAFKKKDRRKQKKKQKATFDDGEGTPAQLAADLAYAEERSAAQADGPSAGFAREAVEPKGDAISEHDTANAVFSPAEPPGAVQSIFPGLARVKRRAPSVSVTSPMGSRAGDQPGHQEGLEHTSPRSLPMLESRTTLPNDEGEDSPFNAKMGAVGFAAAALAAATAEGLRDDESPDHKNAPSTAHRQQPLDTAHRAPAAAVVGPAWSFDGLSNPSVAPESPVLGYRQHEIARDSGYQEASTPVLNRHSTLSRTQEAPELRTATSRESLRSRRSAEPLHIATEASPDWELNVPKTRLRDVADQATEDVRTPSQDILQTPLESTTKNRASYLFQSPPANLRGLPDDHEPREDDRNAGASDYFAHNRNRSQAFGNDVSASSPPAVGPLSPRGPLAAILEEHNPVKRSKDDSDVGGPDTVKAIRRSETPPAIRDSKQHALSPERPTIVVPSASGVRARSNPLSTDELINRLSWPAVDDQHNTVNIHRSLQRGTPRPALPEPRSPSAASNVSNTSTGVRQRLMSPTDLRSVSRTSNRSATPTLRRIDRSLSGDLRAASRRGDAGSGSAISARSSTKTIPFEAPPTPPSNDEDVIIAGAAGAAVMADVFVSRPDGALWIRADHLMQQGYGDAHGSRVSPTRPPSVRKRQSMHITDLESKLGQLVEENRALHDAQEDVERRHDATNYQQDVNSQAMRDGLETRDLELREREVEINRIQAMLQPLREEIDRLNEINGGLMEANRNLVDDTNGRYATLQAEHAEAHQQWQSSSRELEKSRQDQSQLTSSMRDAIGAQLASALADKNAEIRQLREELDIAAEQIRALQVQIQSSKSTEFLTVRDEDYFDGACQKLCQHVQQWVLRFSKLSDNRVCRLSTELRDDKIENRLDNAILDGSDVDKLLGDRIKRRDVFMSVVMTMVWEYVFTRYLFGMDREQRQKLKALEKILAETGPPRAIAQWRATTLTLLSKRPDFARQCSLDTEAVGHEVFALLSALLPPPSNAEQQLLASLQKVIGVAADLAIEMRTQRAEYIMLPPLQPEYDTNGDLVRKVHFNASLMNERSGLFSSNEGLEQDRAVVKMVLFPLVVKKGDEYGQGEEEIVVCPAQVLVQNDGGKGKKVVRVMSGAMEIDDPRRSTRSLVSTAPGSAAF